MTLALTAQAGLFLRMTLPGDNGGLAPAQRVEGFLVGAVIGASLAASTADCHDAQAVIARLGLGGLPVPSGPPPGRRPAATALADGLMEELIGGGVDLHRLVGRWREWLEHDGYGLDPRTALSLNHLRDFDAPIPAPIEPAIAPMAAVLPAALTGASPQGMVVGAFHVAGLLDPNEEAGLAAVAIVVAGARFLEGRRDFIPDVIAVLRANGAAAELLDGVRFIPRDPRQAPPIPRGDTPHPTATLIWLLWTLHHRPRSFDALHEMTLAGGVSPLVGAVLGALMGAREGMASWPDAWFTSAGEDVLLRRGLARRLNAER